MPARIRRCKHCHGDIPATRPRSKYCRDACRNNWYRKVEAAKNKSLEKNMNATPEYVKKIKDLAFNDSESEMANLVRAVFQDSVRSEIDAHVRDNLLGMTEVLVDMAPEAIHALRQDLASDDDYVRSRAYALWFKYVMPMQAKSEKDDENAPVTVIVNTPFNRRLADLENAPEQVVDVSDWVECYACHKTKHPDAVQLHDTRNKGKTQRFVCRSCYAEKKWATGRGNPMALLDSELFG